MRNALLLFGALATFAGSCAAAAAQVTLEKSPFYTNSSKGTINDIKVIRTGSNHTNVLVLTASKGIVLNQNKVIEKEFPFRACERMQISQNENEECMIFCTGQHSGEIFAATLGGKELWSLKLPNRYVYTMVRHSDGRFFVCTWYDGVRILDRNGKGVGTLNEKLVDINFSMKPKILTLSLSYPNGPPNPKPKWNQRIQLETRDEAFKVLNAFTVEDHAFKIVASNWPQTNAVWYVSKTHLVCLDQNGKKLASLPHAYQVIEADAAMVQDDAGRSYLALSVIHASGTPGFKAKLTIISESFAPVHEELLVHSRAVASCGTRLYVEVRHKILEYRLKNTAKP